MTRIANRRMIDRWMDMEIAKSRKLRSTFSVIYLDIDQFKKLNDKFGHHFGDEVLREFANVVQGLIRHSDRFGRWGGEEFIIIAPSESMKAAEQFAERVRGEIHKHVFREIGTLTASFGVASFRLTDSPLTLLKRADAALYAAKQDGGNTVRVS